MTVVADIAPPLSTTTRVLTSTTAVSTLPADVPPEDKGIGTGTVIAIVVVVALVAGAVLVILRRRRS